MRYSAAEQVRILRKEVDDLRRRLHATVMTGKVVGIEGSKVKLELAETDERTGKPFRSPWIRLGNEAGKAGGGSSTYTRPGMGQQMLMLSPGGEIGQHSIAYPASHTTEEPSPGTAEQDGHVVAIGDAKLEINGGLLRLTVGGVVATLTGEGLAITGGEVTHDGHLIDKSHKHTGVTPGTGLSGPPQ